MKSEAGQSRMRLYKTARAKGRSNFWQVVAAVEREESITDQVLLTLLPHSDTPENRDKGAWIHPTRSGDRDIKGWYEGAGWTDESDWPRVSEAIFALVRRCRENPGDLKEACTEFDGLPYSKGFQTGMLTPILNALRPDQFLLVNDEWRTTIAHFADIRHRPKLIEYPDANATGWRVIDALAPHLHQYDLPDLRDSDLLDMFSHWLVRIKDFGFRPVRYWRIAPGENAWNWDACREGGFISMGWDRLGDLTGMRKRDFEDRREVFKETYPDEDWNEWEAGQVWRFANDIQEGDRIVANRGNSEVLGLGTVVGPYEFEPGVRHGHRLPVRWDDLTSRRVDEEGWTKALARLSRVRFEEITTAGAPRTSAEMATPFSKIFLDREEAEWALDLMAETLRTIGVRGPQDERFSLAFWKNERILRLSFGDWGTILRFTSPDFAARRLGMALIREKAEQIGLSSDWRPLEGTEDKLPICVYRMPLDVARPLRGRLREVHESTLAHIGESFADFTRSPYRKRNVMDVARAVFDREKRIELLAHGIEDP